MLGRPSDLYNLGLRADCLDTLGTTASVVPSSHHREEGIRSFQSDSSQPCIAVSAAPDAPLNDCYTKGRSSQDALLKTGSIGFDLNVSLSFFASKSTATVCPSLTSPFNMSLPSGVSISFWMARLSGRAP